MPRRIQVPEQFQSYWIKLCFIYLLHFYQNSNFPYWFWNNIKVGEDNWNKKLLPQRLIMSWRWRVGDRKKEKEMCIFIWWSCLLHHPLLKVNKRSTTITSFQGCNMKWSFDICPLLVLWSIFIVLRYIVVIEM